MNSEIVPFTEMALMEEFLKENAKGHVYVRTPTPPKVKKGEKAVLLGVAVDSGAVRTQNGGPGANDTYLILDRDSVDLSHFRLDCAAMPNMDTEIPVYIPAISKHEISLESTIGITDLSVYYRYGIAPLTLIEKIRWNYPLTKDEKTIADKFNLQGVVETGVF